MKLNIIEAMDSDIESVLTVERLAFEHSGELELIHNLVRNLLSDASAKPYLSLLALEDDRPVGHVLFTTVRIEGNKTPVSASILAPLAVVRDVQKRGVGAALIKEGFRILSASGVSLVFVLGDPKYYSRHGFEPAWRHGLKAPYPIPEEHKDAWMVMELKPGALSPVKGTIVCAESLDKPEYWL